LGQFVFFFSLLCFSFSANAIIEGALDSKKAYSSTVYFSIVNKGGRGYCTATKIADRHFITAGHCVREPLDPRYFSVYTGEAVYISNAVDLRSTSAMTSGTSAVAVGVYVLDVLEKAAARGMDLNSMVIFPPFVADVAIVEIDRDTDEIPVAEISFEEVKDDAELVAVGYGPDTLECPFTGNAQRRSQKILLKSYSYYKEKTGYGEQGRAFYELLLSNYQGLSAQKQQPVICPGDSGGSVFDKNGKLVGVVSFSHMKNRVPVLDQYTRLDTKSLHKVGDWIRQIID
jgi:hypothetical protein